jgi:hypothetical protein
MISESRRNYSKEIGNNTEDLFVSACTKLGYACTKTNASIDIFDHIDFYIDRPSGRTSVDVKGNNTIDSIWVEFKNVRGKDGWLYGKAQYIAFDMPELNGFVMVGRNELKDRCEEIIEKVFVGKNEAIRKLYTRYGREDVIAQIQLNDISDLKSYRLIKY